MKMVVVESLAYENVQIRIYGNTARVVAPP